MSRMREQNDSASFIIGWKTIRFNVPGENDEGVYLNNGPIKSDEAMR